MKMIVTTTIQKDWSDYNKTLAICQMDNNGVIFLDDYGCPIDNEFQVDEMFEDFIHGDNGFAYNSRFYLSLKELRFVGDYETFENEKDNFVFMDEAYSLETVGRNYFISVLKPETNEFGAYVFESFEKHIDFKGIGEDLFLDRKKPSGFSEYGFIIRF